MGRINTEAASTIDDRVEDDKVDDNEVDKDHNG